MSLPDVKYALSDDTISSTITALEFARSRYEREAAVLISATQRSQDEKLVRLSWKLGRERLEQANVTAALVDFYLNL